MTPQARIDRALKSINSKIEALKIRLKVAPFDAYARNELLRFESLRDILTEDDESSPIAQALQDPDS